jgi:peptidoglycan hydrolase-like protein with peptidoglycan-binding domain
MTTESFRVGTGTRRIPLLAVVMAAVMLLLVVPSQAAAASRSSQMLAEGIGMKHKPSVRVRALQRTLASHGYSVGRKGADGRFGPRTERAVRRFQRASHLRADGIVGPRTRAALRRVARRDSSKSNGTRDVASKKAPAATSSPASSTAPVGRPAQAAQPSPQPSGQAQPQPRADSGASQWSVPWLVWALAALVAPFAAIALVRLRPRARAMAARHSRVTMERPAAAIEPSPVEAEPVAVVAEPVAVVAEPVAMPAEPVTIADPAPAADALLLTEAASGGETPPVANGGFAPVMASRLAAHDAVIGYVSVPADAGPGDVAASERAIERVCERSGWRLVDIVRDPACASLSDPEALTELLEPMADGEASALVVSDAWALCRSVDVAELLKRLDSVGAALVAIDLGVDTSTAQGRRVAKALINMSGWGRRPSTRTVVAAAAEAEAETRESEGWVGRLSLDLPQAHTPAAPAGPVILNGTRNKARNGTGAIALNGNGNGNGHTARNGNGAPARNGSGAIALNGNGATARNGTGAIALNGNGATAHGGENDHSEDANGNGRPRPMRLAD